MGNVNAYDNARILIDKYNNVKDKIRSRYEKNKTTDEFVITLNSLAMIMTESERENITDLLYEYNLVNIALRSIKRIEKNKSMAFI